MRLTKRWLKFHGSLATITTMTKIEARQVLWRWLWWGGR